MRTEPIAGGCGDRCADSGSASLPYAGATAVAAFVEPARRGRAIGALGLASAAPQFVLVPVAPWLAERAGFGALAVGFTGVWWVLPRSASRGD
jgi:hypothetical protein